MIRRCRPLVHRSGIRRTVALLIAMLGGAGHASAAVAQEMEVPVAIQVPLFLKVMSFDRLLKSRAGDELIVMVAYQSGNHASLMAKDEVLRAMSAGSAAVDGITIRTIALDLDRESLADGLRDQRVALLYVTPLRAFDIGAVAAAARAAHATTITGVPRYVALGLAISVRLQGDRPKLLVNVQASRLEGAELSAELLKLAQVTP
jgi:hypothetical protein